MTNIKYIIYYPSSHEHLHLFDDLKKINEVILSCVKPKTIKNQFIKKIQRLHLSHSLNKIIPLPLKKVWYEYYKISPTKSDIKYKVIVMDGALNGLSTSYLNHLIVQKNIDVVLVLINSINAQSVNLINAKDTIKKINWTAIWTFDPNDAKNYGWHYLPPCYYSKYPLINDHNIIYDAYFLGGLKGNRTNMIMNVFDTLNKNHCKCKFQVMLSGKERLKDHAYEDRIDYFYGGWIPYESTLKNVLESNCIIEILQEGQAGQSLRYFEAICYNKKLLTNNPNVKDLPFYNPNYIKIINNLDQIDINWIKRKERIDYQYKNQFSPIFMLKIIFRD